MVNGGWWMVDGECLFLEWEGSKWAGAERAKLTGFRLWQLRSLVYRSLSPSPWRLS